MEAPAPHPAPRHRGRAVGAALAAARVGRWGTLKGGEGTSCCPLPSFASSSPHRLPGAPPRPADETANPHFQGILRGAEHRCCIRFHPLPPSAAAIGGQYPCFVLTLLAVSAQTAPVAGGERSKGERGHLAVPSPPFHPHHPIACRPRRRTAPYKPQAIIFRAFCSKRSTAVAFVSVPLRFGRTSKIVPAYRPRPSPRLPGRPPWRSGRYP